MQKILYVYDNSLSEVNELLRKGWKVVSVNPVSTSRDDYVGIRAYVVLEASNFIYDEGERTI